SCPHCDSSISREEVEDQLNTGEPVTHDNYCYHTPINSLASVSFRSFSEHCLSSRIPYMSLKHSDEFKRDSVRIALTSGLKRREVSSDLNIGLSTLGKWIASISDEPKIPSQNSDLLRENERLRKENRILREEREILN